RCWADENLLELECKEIGEHYGRYRLHLPEAERAMARSLERYGQLSPVVVCRRQDRYELIDGFKRLGAARGLARMPHLWARRLALIERLGPKAKDELRVGLLSPTAARQIVRLPEGNQAEVLEAIRREALSSAEFAGVVDLWLGCAERRQQEYVLQHPREALS